MELFRKWRLLEFDFTAVAHVSLEAEISARSFRWFATHVGGILATPTSLTHIYFADREADYE